MKKQNKREEILEDIQRIVIKVGTSTLTDENGQLNLQKMKKIVVEISNLQDKGYDVILVSSGAVGAGMGLLEIEERPKLLSEKQMLSAVGQVTLMQVYQTFFKKYDKLIGQLLLTKGEFSNRKRYLNVRNVCNAFLDRKIIPIINAHFNSFLQLFIIFKVSSVSSILISIRFYLPLNIFLIKKDILQV